MMKLASGLGSMTRGTTLFLKILWVMERTILPQILRDAFSVPHKRQTYTILSTRVIFHLWRTTRILRPRRAILDLHPTPIFLQQERPRRRSSLFTILQSERKGLRKIDKGQAAFFVIGLNFGILSLSKDEQNLAANNRTQPLLYY